MYPERIISTENLENNMNRIVNRLKSKNGIFSSGVHVIYFILLLGFKILRCIRNQL